jgi:hypothetical protein
MERFIMAYRHLIKHAVFGQWADGTSWDGPSGRREIDASWRAPVVSD